MIFPATRPDESPSDLWQLQQTLISHAESQVGCRDQAKQIYQPTFAECGPQLINTPSFDGAFAKLSLSAAGYWPTAVYELAHETIHLLNPVAGYTSYLEEGVAVAFSVSMSAQLTTHPQQPTNPAYLEALSLASSLPGGVFVAASQIRQRCGSLFATTKDDLEFLFPSIPSAVKKRLTETCVPN